MAVGAPRVFRLDGVLATVGMALAGSAPASSHLTPVRRSVTSRDVVVFQARHFGVCRLTSPPVALRTENSGRSLSDASHSVL